MMVKIRVEYNSLGYAIMDGKMWDEYYLVIPNRNKPFFLCERRIQ